MKKKNKKIQHSFTDSALINKKPEASYSLSGFFGSNNFYFLILGIVIVAVSIVRWRLVPMPLERDEGEYAYFGHLILNGITPYREAYNMKLPGIYYMYALIMAVFGESYSGIHIGFLVMNAGTMLLLFLSVKNFFNQMTGLIAAALYGLMAMSSNVLGFAAHATHFAMFYVSLSLFFLFKYEKNKKAVYAFITGAMFGMAFLMKQQAVYFILFGGIVFLIFQIIGVDKVYMPKSIKQVRGGQTQQPSGSSLTKIFINTSIFSLGVFVPYIIVLIIMLATGTFGKFWFWTVKYASKYASGLPWESGKELLKMTFNPIWEEHKWIYLLAIAGVVIVSFTKYSLKQKILAICLTLSGILATTPGFYFRQHYFVVVLPAIALLAGIALDYAGRFIANKLTFKAAGISLPLVILFLLFNSTFSNGKFYYSTENPVALCKAIYGANPFTESVEIANYIKANSSYTDKIAVLGSEPQILFYADRKSATGYIYTYGLMEIHQYNLLMQEEMISEIEKNKPLFLVFVNVSFSWLSKPDSPKKIFDWYGKYAAENYQVVGLVDISNQGQSSIYWNADAQRQPQNQNCVWVFKRKDAASK